MPSVLSVPVQRQIKVQASPGRAFRAFTQGISQWWTVFVPSLAVPQKKTMMEPRADGRWYLCEPDGFQTDVGRVLLWNEPKRIVLNWQVNHRLKYDPDFLMEIDVRFEPQGRLATLVKLEHRPGEGMSHSGLTEARLDASEAWDTVLRQFAVEAEWGRV